MIAKIHGVSLVRALFVKLLNLLVIGYANHSKLEFWIVIDKISFSCIDELKVPLHIV